MTDLMKHRLALLDFLIERFGPKALVAPADDEIKRAYVAAFGSKDGWLDVRGSAYIEGYRDGRKAVAGGPTCPNASISGGCPCGYADCTKRARGVRVFRECCNAECGWKGETDRMLGTVGPLCPECGEVTEPIANDVPLPAAGEPLETIEWWAKTVAERGSDGMVAHLLREYAALRKHLAGVKPCAHLWRDYGRLGGRNVSWCSKCDTLAWTGQEPDGVQRLSGEALSAVTKRCFDTGGNSACADVSPSRCTLCPNRKDGSGVDAPDAAQAFTAKLNLFARLSRRAGELFERCQGKGWPDAESAEFTSLRDERLPALRAELESIAGAHTEGGASHE